MTKSPDEAWGFTRKMDFVHKFRKNQCIHRTSAGGGHGWLFVPKPDWDPTHPLTCPDCLRQLESEKKIEELARTKEKVKV